MSTGGTGKGGGGRGGASGVSLADQMVNDMVGYLNNENDIDLNKYENLLSPYMREYTTYRLWDPNENIDARIESSPYLATARSGSAIRKMIQEDDFEPGPITRQTGTGFDPYQVIRDGLSRGSSSIDSNYAKEVVSRMEYQQEIVMTRINGQPTRMKLK